MQIQDGALWIKQIPYDSDRFATKWKSKETTGFLKVIQNGYLNSIRSTSTACKNSKHIFFLIVLIFSNFRECVSISYIYGDGFTSAAVCYQYKSARFEWDSGNP